MTKPQFNEALLNRVVEHLEDVPERFVMETWQATLDDMDEEDVEGVLQVPDCGSVSCVAGTTCILAGTAPIVDQVGDHVYYGWPRLGWFQSARIALRLTKEQAERLFYLNNSFSQINGGGSCWPAKFGIAYRRARTPRKRVEVLKARIDHFKRTGW